MRACGTSHSGSPSHSNTRHDASETLKTLRHDLLSGKREIISETEFKCIHGILDTVGVTHGDACRHGMVGERMLFGEWGVSQ